MFHQYIKKPKVTLVPSDMRRILENLNELVLLTDLSPCSRDQVRALFPGSCILECGSMYVAARRVNDPPAVKIQLKATKGLEGLPTAFAQTLLAELHS